MFKLSEEKFIERLRRKHRTRKPVGVFSIILGLTLVVASLVMEAKTESAVSEITSALFYEGAELETLHLAGKVAYLQGLRFGISLSAMAISGISCVILGLSLLFGLRSERLLLEKIEGSK